MPGLKKEEYLSNLKKYGKNTLGEVKRPNIFILFLKEFNDWLVFILFIAALISIIIEPNNFIESSIIFAILLINATIGVYQEIKAFKTLNSLKKLSKHKVKVYRDDELIMICADDLVVDDIVQLNNGDAVDADMLVLESSYLKVDESVITGEAIPIYKNDADMLYRGSFLTNGNAICKVIKIGKETKMGSIAKSLVEKDENKTPLEEKLSQIGKVIGIIALFICLIVFLIEIALKETPLNAVKSAISLAVAAIPEGLTAVVTVCLALGVKRMAKSNVIIKKLEAVETLGCTGVICTDKTGTLTENLQKIISIYENKLYESDEITTKLTILEYAYLLSNPYQKEFDSIIDPIDKAIVTFYNDKNFKQNACEIIEYVPFDSLHKYMYLRYKENGIKKTIYKGSLENIANSLGITPDKRLLKEYQKELQKGYRIIAVSDEYSFIGFIAMQDKARFGVIETIELAKVASIKTVMITGDHKDTALAIGRELNIVKNIKEVCNKDELDLIDEENLTKKIMDYSLFSRVLPFDKVKILEAYQENNQIVAFIGDGINDAPAIKKADIGCAMGNATDITKDSASMILVDSNYKTMIKAVKEGRGIYQNIKRCVKYLLSSNIGEIFTIFFVTFLSLILKIDLGIPLLPLHLLWINVITDSLPAFGLGIEKPNDELMKKKPRKKDEGFFVNGLGNEIIFYGITIGLLTVIAYFLGLKLNPSMASTMAFMTLSTTQLFHSYNCKTEGTIFRRNIFKNKLLLISFILGLSLELVVIYQNGINAMFNLVPLGFIELMISLLLSLSIILVAEIIKLLTHKDRIE